MFFKNEENKKENNFLVNICALLIHAAKIDENYTNKEEEIIKKTLIELGINKHNMANTIKDAKIIEETSWENKKRFGRFSYLLSAFNVASQEAPRITITPDQGKPIEGAFVLIGNGSLYGPALKVFSKAKNDDGLLDVMVFDKQKPGEIIKYVSSIALGMSDKASGIH